MLEQIKIILVETSHPGNIGGAARAMKNMGFFQLVLVRPKLFPDGLATAMASGADDLLAAATIVDTLEEALEGAQLVFGTSARQRQLSWPLMTPANAARLIQAEPQQSVAIVFGREDSGLTNEELALCRYHIKIPTVDSFSSLNLAAAVQVMTYAIRAALIESSAETEKVMRTVANSSDFNGFIEHLEQTLVATQFLDPKQPKALMRRLRRLFLRAELDLTEINILRGILSSVANRINLPN